MRAIVAVGWSALAAIAVVACTQAPSGPSIPVATANASQDAVVLPTLGASVRATDCDGLALDYCRAAVDTAVAFGVYPEDGQQVVAWRARPTKYTVCDGVSRPTVDVTFQLVDPAGQIVVTVGELPNHRLTVCTY